MVRTCFFTVKTEVMSSETHFSPQTQSADIINSPVTTLHFVKSSETNLLSVKWSGGTVQTDIFHLSRLCAAVTFTVPCEISNVSSFGS